MSSLFTRIVRGEVPCHKVGEDADYLAFLDINPVRRGHTLVIPKVEVDKFFDLPAEVLAGIMPFAQGVAKRMAAVIPCDRIGVSVIGLEVPHAHVHLIPIDSLHDMDFSRPKVKLSNEELAALAERIRKA
ncbi:MAG: HIT family protein [Flavobacteriales bacterium]|nr:HIT family protein [Flavobacteriales bacterium]MBP9080602.1 HIT family protein [Flavobacteriales bacterium]